MLATLRDGAIPYIPFKTNSVPQSIHTPKSERSNVETTFHMIKSKFGQRLRSRTLTAQVNEALCKLVCHNMCVVIQSVYELGIEPEFEFAA